MTTKYTRASTCPARRSSRTGSENARHRAPAPCPVQIPLQPPTSRKRIDTSGDDPVAVGDELTARQIGKMHDVAAFGGKTLVRRQRQPGVISRQDPMLQQAL